MGAFEPTATEGVYPAYYLFDSDAHVKSGHRLTEETLIVETLLRINQTKVVETINRSSMKTINELGLTELEIKVLSTLIDCLYAEAGFTDQDCNDLAKETGLKVNVVKGVVGSLIKKGICTTDDTGDYDLIGLAYEYWFLHPRWVSEYKA